MDMIEVEVRLDDADVEALLEGFFRFHDVCDEVMDEVMKAFREYRVRLVSGADENKTREHSGTPQLVGESSPW
jgi:hypothetical protein